MDRRLAEGHTGSETKCAFVVGTSIIEVDFCSSPVYPRSKSIVHCSYILIEKNTPICSTSENPWLSRMKCHRENSKFICNGVSSENLDWDDQRIAHQV